MKKSKFYIKDQRTFKQKLSDFGQSMLFWRGRKKGMVHTMNIEWDDIRKVFFPKNFHEKYGYLGCVPWGDGDIFKAMEPLVIFMDYKAKPWWCPRWFLRFLHLFGDDNSIVRVRNRRLSELKRKITKGYGIMDYKTKWQWYDLRISIAGTDQMWNLANAIEQEFYDKGAREDLSNQIKALDPNTKYNKGYTVNTLREELNRLLGYENT
jgi:hypothetical protein